MAHLGLSRIRIVLVEPAGALNVGSVARVMKNMGLQQLVLVNPQCDRLSEEAKRMAVHGKELLEKAQVYQTIPEALAGCQRACATTARQRTLPTRLESPKEALGWLLEGESALIFGPEERGLSNEELNYAQRFITIPANPDYPVLNLAQAVTICAYELYQITINSPPPEKDLAEKAPLEALEGYYQHLEAVLLKIGYLYPHTASARMEKFRRLYNRAALSKDELAMLRGILRQIDWAVQQKSPHNSQDWQQ